MNKQTINVNSEFVWVLKTIIIKYDHRFKLSTIIQNLGNNDIVTTMKWMYEYNLKINLNCLEQQIEWKLSAFVCIICNEGVC